MVMKLSSSKTLIMILGKTNDQDNWLEIQSCFSLPYFFYINQK